MSQKKQNKAQLWTINDLDDPRNRIALEEVTLAPRLNKMLKGMDKQPFTMKTEMEIGDKSRSRPRIVFSASEVGNSNGKSPDGKYKIACARYLWYSYTGTKTKKTDPQLRMIMDTGTAIHSQLQAYFHKCAEQQGFVFLSELGANPSNNKRADKYLMSMHMDGECRIVMPEYNVRFGVEIKSINDSRFKTLLAAKNKEGGEGGPLDQHITQGMMYQYVFDLPVMLFVYYNKNNSTIAEFVQEFDRSRWNAIVKKTGLIKKDIDSGTPSPQEPSSDCYMCKYRDICNPPRKKKDEVLNAFRTKKQGK